MDKLLKFVASTVMYVVGYTILLVPTYVLPYMGSNSLLVQSASASVGAGVVVLLLIHLAFLGGLVALAWARGKVIDKSWLVGLPIAAAMFDILPGLSMIPMVPTILHLVALLAGVVNNKPVVAP